MQNDEVTATYLYGTNLLSTNNGTSTNYYLFNAHGDVTGIADDAQTVTKTYDYDAFGNEKNPSATDTNPFRYCGEYFDKETGTYYLRARYYDPAIGRFTQQDTHWNTANMIYGDNPNKINEREDALGLKTYTYTPSISSIMQSGNLYVYGINNPILYQDLSGDFARTAAIVGKMVLGATINLTTSYISAKVTGQNFTVTDALSSILSGAIGGINVFAGAAVSFLASGCVELVEGASPLEAGVVALSSGLSTAVSVSGLVQISGVNNLLATSLVDLTFGTGNACIYASITPTVVNFVSGLNDTNNSTSYAKDNVSFPEKSNSSPNRTNGNSNSYKKYNIIHTLF